MRRKKKKKKRKKGNQWNIKSNSMQERERLNEYNAIK